MGWVGVVAVDPHASRLNATSHALGAVHVAGPDAGAQAILGVVGDGQSLGLIFEGGDRNNRAEDLLLEDAHLVVALEYGGFDIEAAALIAR